MTLICQEIFASGGNLVKTFISYWYKLMDFLAYSILIFTLRKEQQ